MWQTQCHNHLEMVEIHVVYTANKNEDFGGGLWVWTIKDDGI